MKNHVIKVRPDRLSCPLAACVVGKLSSAVFIICGDIPDDIDGIVVQIGRTDDATTTPPTPRENVAAVAKRQADGSWRCYLAPFFFADESDSHLYHVVGKDTHDNDRWLGTGSLVVRRSPAGGSPIVPEPLPRDSYAYNPVTGLYHKMTANVDEFGNITIEVESEGIER